ncbi:OmpA family protein [Spirillospora sp. NPDC052242]
MRVQGALAAALVLPLALVAACDGGDGGGPAATAGTEKTPAYTGPMVKEAWSALGGGRSRIEVKEVGRLPDRSLLRFYLTNPGKEATFFSFGTSVAGSAFGNLHFTLVDPVGHKAYTPLYDGGGLTVGSETRWTSVHPGVRYETVLAFPPLPESVRRITVISPTTAGEFTGVPVVTGGPKLPAAPAVPDGLTAPGAGTTVSFPMRNPTGETSGGTHDLYSLTEGEAKSTTSSSTEETIGLRTDVLFAFDQAALSARAKAVLDEVARETRAKADPAKPPIRITGHTDSKGADDYNVDLSRRRADAVLEALRARLGPGYRYEAAGKGETEPIAREGGANDAEARGRNRRVEISYKIKQRTAATAATTSRAPRDERATGAGAPAPFRPRDGATVASRTASFGAGDRRRIDVKPFYRDGAYLVAVFDIANLGPAAGPASTADYQGDHGSYGRFGAFSVLDPASGTAYRAVRMGPQDPVNVNLAFVDPGWAVFRTEPGTSNRGFVYVPAPPPDVRSVTFDAGPFGRIPNVPIR